jgi:uroporphyrinogen-III synthase
MADSNLVWLTRPRDDSESFSAELALQHVASLVAPVMHIVHRPLASLPDLPDAILLTSRHATQALAGLPAAWRALPTYCVGAATANYARDFGFNHLIPGAADVMSLLPRLISDLPQGSNLLYFAGEETRADVPTLLGTRGIHVQSITVYRAVAETALAPELRDALASNRLAGAAFFSPRSASIACELIAQAGLAEHVRNIHAYCMSLNVAKAAGLLPWKALHACHAPTRRAMRELIISHHPKTV